MEDWEDFLDSMSNDAQRIQREKMHHVKQWIATESASWVEAQVRKRLLAQGHRGRFQEVRTRIDVVEYGSGFKIVASGLTEGEVKRTSPGQEKLRGDKAKEEWNLWAANEFGKGKSGSSGLTAGHKDNGGGQAFIRKGSSGGTNRGMKGMVQGVMNGLNHSLKQKVNAFMRQAAKMTLDEIVQKSAKKFTSNKGIYDFARTINRETSVVEAELQKMGITGTQIAAVSKGGIPTFVGRGAGGRFVSLKSVAKTI